MNIFENVCITLIQGGYTCFILVFYNLSCTLYLSDLCVSADCVWLYFDSSFFPPCALCVISSRNQLFSVFSQLDTQNCHFQSAQLPSSHPTLSSLWSVVNSSSYLFSCSQSLCVSCHFSSCCTFAASLAFDLFNNRSFIVLYSSSQPTGSNCHKPHYSLLLLTSMRKNGSNKNLKAPKMMIIQAITGFSNLYWSRWLKIKK